MSIAAYKRTISETESPRQIERRVLSQVTAELESYSQEYDQAEKPLEKLAILSSGLRDVLWRNERIWIALKNDLAEPRNTLPPELKASLISLALWVENHTRGVLSGSQKTRPLIEINKSIIRGLSGQTLTVLE